MKKSLLSFTLLLQLSSSAFAQQPTPTPAASPGAEPPKSESQQPARQSDDDVVRITTNLVQVDAVVTDNKGKLVTDLRVDEVEILEDKKPQQITKLDKRSVKANLKTQVRLFRNGEQVYTGQELPLDSGSQLDPQRFSTGGVIRIGAEMLPGEYVLQVVVTDLLAKEGRRLAAQWIDFDIVE